MGIKTLKERFDIKHIVEKDGDRILISSAYVSGLIQIFQDDRGQVIIHSNSPGGFCLEVLDRILSDLKAAARSGELQEIIQAEDEYGPLTQVWTFKKGRVIKKYCEEFGWPNVTTDGERMYENTFFLSREEALERCRYNASGTFVLVWKYHFMDAYRKLFDGIESLFVHFGHLLRAYILRGM